MSSRPPKPTAKHDWEFITPTYAKHVLAEKNYSDNRNIQQTHVDYLMRQLMGDHWEANGEPVIFDVEDHLLNGQHRLAAISGAHRGTWVLVVRGVPTSAYATMDTGRTRPIGYTVGTMGYKNATKLAAMARLHYYWNTRRKGYLSTGKNFPRLSPAECDEVLTADSDLIESCNFVCSSSGIRQFGYVSLTGHLFFLFRQVDLERAVKFMTSFGDGINLGRRNPILVLRETMNKRSMQDKKTNRLQHYTLIVGAWNYFMQGKSVSRLMLSSNGIPVDPPAIHGLEE